MLVVTEREEAAKPQQGQLFDRGNLRGSLPAQRFLGAYQTNYDQVPFADAWTCVQVRAYSVFPAVNTRVPTPNYAAPDIP